MNIDVRSSAPAAVTDQSNLIPLVCRSIRQESSDAKSYTFATAQNASLPFRAGQFLNFTFSVNGSKIIRSYSISSSMANSSRIMITVKRVEGGAVSAWLFNYFRVGDHALAEGPLGAFTDEGVAGPIAFLTAGSGITPVASMIRSYLDHCEDRDIVLLHFAPSPEDMIFSSEFSLWARALPRARIILVATRPPPGCGWVGPTGRMSDTLVSALIPDIRDRTVFACGPDGFMQTAKSIADRIGISAERFFQESFTPSPCDEEGATGPSNKFYDIHFSRSSQTTSCGEQMSVLKSAQSVKVNIQTSCGKGICGTCRVKLISGTVSMDHAGGIKQREIDQGFILACCSRPTSDLIIER